MDRRIARMYLADSAAIWVALVVMWAVLGFVLLHVLPLSNEALVRAVIAGSAVMAGVFATGALVALLLHLSRQREALYREDLSHSESH